MTVETDLNTIDHAPDGVSLSFGYNFRVDDASYMKVYADGEVYTGNAYTVSDLGNPLGGLVTFTDIPPVTITKLTLLRELPIIQLTDYPEYGKLPSEDVERNMDELTFICQQLEEGLSRTIQANPGQDPGTSTGGGGVTDHGSLTGLSDDDHAYQYLSKYNLAYYSPTKDFHPATRKFVLDTITTGGGGVTDHGSLSGLSDDDHSAVYLAKDNTLAYDPSAGEVTPGDNDYFPATKKYVDDSGGGTGEWTNAGSYTILNGMNTTYHHILFWDDQDQLPNISQYNTARDVTAAQRAGVGVQWWRSRKCAIDPADTGRVNSQYRMDYYPERTGVGQDVNFTIVNDFRLPYIFTGTHNGSAGAATLSDSTANFGNPTGWPGDIVKNVTTGAYGVVTSATTNTITATLSSGSWGAGDEYILGAHTEEGYFTEEGSSSFGIWNFVIGPKTDPESLTFRGLIGTEMNVGEREADFGYKDWRNDTTFGDPKFSVVFQAVPEDTREWQDSVTGAHTGATSSTVLVDSGAVFGPASTLIGDRIYNTTTGEYATITANTSTTITGTLSGSGTWTAGNLYKLSVMRPSGYNNSYQYICAPQTSFERSVRTHVGYAIEHDTITADGTGVLLSGDKGTASYTDGSTTVVSADLWGYQMGGTGAILTDKAQRFTAAHVGMTIQNITAGTSGTITLVTSSIYQDNCTATISFTTGDRYVITGGRVPPKYAMKVINKWQAGIDFRSATFTASDEPALWLDEDQSIRFDDSSIQYDSANTRLTMYSQAGAGILLNSSADIYIKSTTSMRMDMTSFDFNATSLVDIDAGAGNITVDTTGTFDLDCLGGVVLEGPVRTGADRAALYLQYSSTDANAILRGYKVSLSSFDGAGVVLQGSSSNGYFSPAGTVHLGASGNEFENLYLNGSAYITGNIVMYSMPTSNPGSGKLWNDGGFVKMGT